MRLSRLFLLGFPLALAAAPYDIPPALARKFFGDQDPSKSGPSTGFSNDGVDNSIIPSEYMVGSGDAFQIGIIGLPSHEYSTTVDPDGKLYIAEVGQITVGKAPLTEAIPTIKKAFRAALKNRYDVYVALKKCKRPVVTVVGSVSNPGTFRMEGTSRLLDAVKLGNQGQLPSIGEANLRRVRCSNGDSTRTYDLLKAIAGGDASQNPYVYPGDRIEIRSVDYTVFLGGEITGTVQGRLPLVPGETLGSLMGWVTPKSSADTSYVLHRRSGQGTRKLSRAEAASLVLADNDVISIPSIENFGTQDTVQVSGEAVRPGTYPIEWGKTTAEEILEQAGGSTPEGSLRRAFLVRANKLIAPGTTYLSPKANSPGAHWAMGSGPIVRPEISASLNDVVSNGDYAIIGFDDIPAKSIRLESGDEVHIPRKEDFVYVSGYVRNPGAYPYKAGEGLSHYVGLAQGYSPKADKPNVVVMRYYRGLTQMRDASTIEEGDVIVVPASVEFKRMTGVYLPVIQTLATIVMAVVTVVVNLR